MATDYMEGKLPLVRRLRARRHLLLCEACRHYYDQLRRTVALLATGRRMPPPLAVENQILAAVQADPSGDSLSGGSPSGGSPLGGSPSGA